MKAGLNQTTIRRARPLQSLLVIAIGEWKRLAFSFSFVVLVFLPPLVILLYPPTYELISEGIRDWQAEQDRLLRTTRATPRLSEESMGSDSEPNTIRFSVIDQSTWVHRHVKEKLLRTDLQVFLDVLYNLEEAEFARWAHAAINELNDVHSIGDRSLFQNNLIEFHRVLLDEGSIREHTEVLAKRLEQKESANTVNVSSDSLLELWLKTPEKIIELAPLVSIAFFTEIEIADSSIDRVQSMLRSREISGYIIIPSGLTEYTDGLQLIALQDTSKLVVDELKTFYQSLLRDVVREQMVAERVRLNNDELPALEIRQSEIDPSNIEVDTVQIRYEDWGSPAKLASFVTGHLPVLASLIVLTCVIGSGPVFVLSTLEERSSKLAETLLASTDTKLLFDAKVWGGIVGIASILGCWLVFRVVYLVVMTPEMPFEILPNLHAAHLLHWSLFLILALAFYGYIAVAIGSKCNNQIDFIAIMIPVLVVQSIASYVVFALFDDPDTLAASILSFFPPFAPFVMIARTGVLPSWPVYLTISFLLLVSVVVIREIGSSFFSRAFLLEKGPTRKKSHSGYVRKPR